VRAKESCLGDDPLEQGTLGAVAEQSSLRCQ
jgi:hypothetical protein